MSDMLRITGLVSGMDTDTTVKQLIKLEQTKVDKAKQEKQYLEWQKEDYKEIANLLRGLNDEFFDILKPASNLRSSTAFNVFSAAATVAGSTTSSISLKTSTSSVKGSFTIDSVTSIATKDAYTSTTEVKGNIISSDLTDANLVDLNTKKAADKEISFTFDGVTKTLTLQDADYGSYSEYASDLSTKLQEAFQGVDIQVDVNGGAEPYNLEFKIYKNGTAGTTNEVESGHTLTVGSKNTDLLGVSGLKEGQSSSVNLDKSIEDVFGVTDTASIVLNDVNFEVTKDTTVKEFMTQVNSSSANVTISYDTMNDKFTIESNKEGTDYTISATDSQNLLTSMKITNTTADHTAASNAEFSVNGVSTTRTSNTFEVNGTEVTLNEIPTGPVTVNISADTTNVKDLIVKFVDKYNSVIKSINDKTSESRDYDYSPLTDEQKEAMTDDDIEAWQAAARKGTLSNDFTLEKITTQLRTALYESVEGMGISLADIGIQASSNYKEGGKLVIDETKLDKALEERPNEIIELFTRESDTAYTDFDNRSTRYNENGIAARLHDILQDNIRITRDDGGRKGYLIDKAGPETGVDATSDMAKKIKVMDDKIADLLEMLADKEETYYAQFSAMETAMSQYSSQSAYLTSQFGG
jgi:flagellar hook-associated protein 2